VSDSVELTDVHCHLIPGLDDGPGTSDESLAMARLAVADGIGTVIATPHQLGGYARNGGELIRAKTCELQQRLDNSGVPLRVLPGAEVRIEPELARKVRKGEVLTLADAGRYVLLEMPHDVFFPLDRVLTELRSAGLTGILAHPERNAAILRSPHALESLVEAGCLVQVTGGSLTGTFGPQVERLAQGLVQQGLVHLVASDGHGVQARRPLLRRAVDVLRSLAGEEAAIELCCRNPAAIAAGGLIPQGRRLYRKAAASGWFRWRRAG